MMPLQLNKSEVSLRPELHFDQLPLRNLDVVKEKHFEHERIPNSLNLLKASWTLLVATYLVLQSLLHK